MYVGGIIHQETRVAANFRWAMAHQSFCNRSQGVVALSESETNPNDNLMMRRAGLSADSYLDFVFFIWSFVRSTFDSIISEPLFATGSLAQCTCWSSCFFILDVIWFLFCFVFFGHFWFFVFILPTVCALLIPVAGAIFLMSLSAACGAQGHRDTPESARIIILQLG